MRDDRTSGIYGRGYVSFNKNDSTGIVNTIPDKKRQRDQNSNQRNENENKENEGFNSSPYVDNSDQLKASLNSLAILNAASVINSQKLHMAKLKNISKNTTNPFNKL